jgi:hypothetical protein
MKQLGIIYRISEEISLKKRKAGNQSGFRRKERRKKGKSEKQLSWKRGVSKAAVSLLHGTEDAVAGIP